MSSPIDHILVPTDFSEAGSNAVQIAIQLAVRHEAVLHLVHVIENSYFVTAPEPGIAIGAITTGMEDAAADRLENLQRKIRQQFPLLVEMHLTKGTPFEEICTTAVAINAGLIVMGTHGAAGVKEFLMGTNAFSVVKSTTVPVLTIPANYTNTNFRKVLFPVRPVEGVPEKFNFVQQLLQNQLADIHLAILYRQGEEDRLLDTRKPLSEVIETLESEHYSYTKELTMCGNVANKVLELSRQQQSNLIVINATLDYDWSSFFSGPYTQQVVNHSTVPVLSFRHVTHSPMKSAS